MTTDIFTPGIWVVLQPDGTPMENVCATTGYSARATALRILNKHWKDIEEAGYKLVRCPEIDREALKWAHAKLTVVYGGMSQDLQFLLDRIESMIEEAP